MVEDDDDSDYGQSKKRGKKVIRRGRPDKKERKSPKPRLKATGERNNGSWNYGALLLCFTGTFASVTKRLLLSSVTPSPMKGKGKGRPSTKALEKSSPKEEEEEDPESPLEEEEEEEEAEKKETSPAPKTTKEAAGGDEEEEDEEEEDGSEEEAPSGED